MIGHYFVGGIVLRVTLLFCYPPLHFPLHFGAIPFIAREIGGGGASMCKSADCFLSYVSRISAPAH